ncbi:maltose operon protein MalM [Thorsellia anophelis]|uniref:Maltose operon protein n=1 Tax=Thorsellia anophelis DSM 18579 TaxID=1123402 RepID=A0A1I0B4P1_9GAMM|nr:maltose operon protein MalM [Thorsellia anophelis]SET01460.1 maltose operon protein [Thorsellia anophelis DSM 18579]
MKKQTSKLTNQILKVLTISTMSVFFAYPSFADSEPKIPAIYAQDVQGIQWETFIPNIKKEVVIGSGSPSINSAGINGRIAAITMPADRGTLDINITSVIENSQVFIPNVLVLDESFQPAAFFASKHFKYEQAGIMSNDRVEGKIKLTPAIGQKQIYLVIFTSPEDLKGQTTMVAAAKAYAAGTGHAIPDIPDPIARHASEGRLIVEVKAQNNSNDNVIVGLPLFNSSDKDVVKAELLSSNVNTATTVNQAPKPILSETANYFDENIKNAVAAGDINKALQLLEEAERLGSKTARNTFVKSIEQK